MFLLVKRPQRQRVWRNIFIRLCFHLKQTNKQTLDVLQKITALSQLSPCLCSSTSQHLGKCLWSNRVFMYYLREHGPYTQHQCLRSQFTATYTTHISWKNKSISRMWKDFLKPPYTQRKCH